MKFYEVTKDDVSRILYLINTKFFKTDYTRDEWKGHSGFS